MLSSSKLESSRKLYYQITHLKYLLPSLHAPLKLIDDGVESWVGSSGPLQTLGDTKLLTVDLVKNGGELGSHLLSSKNLA